jgi:hypothetical protein
VTAVAEKESHCAIADDHPVWSYDPDDLLLDASTNKRDCNTLPEPLCAEIGRRLLLAELEFGDWVVDELSQFAASVSAAFLEGSACSSWSGPTRRS